MERYSLYFNELWLPQNEAKISVLDKKETDSVDNFILVNECEKADFAILPFFLNREKYHKYHMGLNKIIDYIKQWNKKLIIFYMNDDNDYLNLENTVTFRPGLYKSLKRIDEYPCPFFLEDLCSLENDNKIKLVKRENTFTPIIGFCGDVNALYAGQEIRKRVIAKLVESRWCKTNFILRTSFHHHQTPEQKVKRRKEYLENLLESEYCLAVRGAGNFSIRFYEICCLGKIPVFIDTDCRLPFDDWINYKNIFIWIEESGIDYAGEKLNCLVRALPDEEYYKRCMAIRELWIQYFSLNGFFKHMGRYLKLSKREG